MLVVSMRVQRPFTNRRNVMKLPTQTVAVYRSKFGTRTGSLFAGVHVSNCVDKGIFWPDAGPLICSDFVCNVQGYPYYCWVNLPDGTHHCYCCTNPNDQC